jgi:arsenite methyltransferase
MNYFRWRFLMSMTPASNDYFERVAGDWDKLQAGYFTDAVREAAIRKAYLRPEMVAADVGAGTGFIAAGLAPLVEKVYVLDGSPQMLAVAKRNLLAFSNLEFREADGLALPLPDGSVDAAFANMYLHHIPEPLAAIRELWRILRPGGRLVITDMDAHPYAWLKEEMADVWQGFERSQIYAWFEEAGLVNVIVDDTQQTCQATKQQTTQGDANMNEARINIFVASGTRRISGMREAVQREYGATAESGASCCTPDGESASCACSTSQNPTEQLIQIDMDTEAGFIAAYSVEERAQAPAEAVEITLGCGNPTAMAGLQSGETVLDIGSGGGLDAILAAHQVGLEGKVIGVDMTPAMLERARRAAEQAGITNVSFRQGMAEALPVEAGSVDVVISNCVINLTEDKGKVFREAFRVLKDGGRLEVSDILSDRAFPIERSQNLSDWASCVSGALPEAEYLDLVKAAGFENILVRRSASQQVDGDVRVYSAQVSARKPG